MLVFQFVAQICKSKTSYKYIYQSEFEDSYAAYLAVGISAETHSSMQTEVICAEINAFT